MASADERPRLPVDAVPGSPPKEVRLPADKHSVAGIRPGSRTGREKLVTMIEPRVDVQADVDAINRGEGHYHPGTGRIWIHERVYAIHTDHRRGTLYPIAGDGFLAITSMQHVVFRKYVEWGGNTPEAEFELARMRGVSDEDRSVAQMLWRMREAARKP